MTEVYRNRLEYFISYRIMTKLEKDILPRWSSYPMLPYIPTTCIIQVAVFHNDTATASLIFCLH